MSIVGIYVGRWMWHKLCKYWILACAALFLLIALQEAVIFRIIYMALFLCFVITFQVGQTSDIIVKYLWLCSVIMMKTWELIVTNAKVYLFSFSFNYLLYLCHLLMTRHQCMSQGSDCLL